MKEIKIFLIKRITKKDNNLRKKHFVRIDNLDLKVSQYFTKINTIEKT